MSQEPPPKGEKTNQQMPDMDAFAKWLAEGLKEGVQYRLKQVLDKDLWLQLLRSKVPSRNQVIHAALKESFIKSGYLFEFINMGEATFHVIRKRLNEKGDRRLVFVPGFGDTPSSWIGPFTFARGRLDQYVDEIVMIDFPGHLGFLSHHQLTPSMDVLLDAVKTVIKANPPTILIGHSLGGWLAGKSAQHPDLAHLKPRMEKLILLCPSGLIPEEDRPSFAEFIKGLRHVPFQKMIKKMVYRPLPYYKLLKKDFEMFYAKPELERFVDSVREDHFIDSHAPFFVEQIFLGWGDHDQFVPTSWMRHWIESFGPVLNVALMKNVGHMLQLERPKTTGDFLLSVIKGDLENHFRWKWVHKTKQKPEYPEPPRNDSNLHKYLTASTNG